MSLGPASSFNIGANLGPKTEVHKSHSASRAVTPLGLQDLAYKKTGCPVKFGFQINKNNF